MSIQRSPRTVTVADDHPVFLQGIKDFLARQDDLDVVGEANCAQSSLDLVNTHKPDIAILDLSMPGDMFRTISEITRTNGATRSIIYTAYCSVDAAIKALDAGANGIVLKSDPVEELLDAIRLQDELAISKKFSTEVLNTMLTRLKPTAQDDSFSLNTREKQIVAQLMLGRTNKEIGEILNLTERTVKHYMTGLMHKMNVRSRVEVVVAVKTAPPDLD